MFSGGSGIGYVDVAQRVVRLRFEIVLRTPYGTLGARLSLGVDGAQVAGEEQAGVADASAELFEAAAGFPVVLHFVGIVVGLCVALKVSVVAGQLDLDQ